MRPHIQLFLHVLGAMTLFGATGALALISLAARSRSQQAPLARAAFGTLLAGALPAWALMLVFGSWTKAKEHLPGTLSWLSIGSGIASAGLAVLLVATGFAYSWTRSPESAWQPRALGALSVGYLGALAVAWWVMSAKVPS